MQRMSAELIHELPPPQRLALAYSPAAARTLTAGLLALDARIAGIVRQRGEVLMAQMRLAWWRDTLAKPAAGWPAGEPLLAQLTPWDGVRPALVDLVNGWEELLHDGPLPAAAMLRFARARAGAFAALAALLNNGAAADAATRAGVTWALGDLVTGLSDPDERAHALDLARDHAGPVTRLPRVLRPLTVLDGLARRSIRRGGAPMLDGGGAFLLAIRLGLTGR